MHRAWCLCWTLLLCSLSSLSYAKDGPWYADKEFNEGKYGRYPKRTFKTVAISAPRPNIMRNFTDCDDGSYIFVAPRGHVTRATFYILDHNLELVWGPSDRYGKVYNFQVQHYKGEPYLFFWGGDDSVGGHGEGKYYMLNQHYEEHKKISAGPGLRGDLHSFTITEEDTAVYTVYEKKEADLTSVGKGKKEWIWEGMFQELNIDTGEIVFEWRASEHFNFTESYERILRNLSKSDPWDWFHINSVEKDKKGNYLVSTRYGRCALYVEGKTGKVLWQLGGKSNSFKDLSGGNATTFLGQHDIHWDGDNAITMFDNRADWFEKLDKESIGHRIDIDLKKMTAKLSQSFYHPEHILSTSQGNLQTLPNGHVLIGYGYNAAFTEFDSNGDVLCDVTLFPYNRMGSGGVQNYRALKSNWTGTPLTVPKLAQENGVLYMSWLGTTKTASWMIEDSDIADEDFQEAQTIPKDGFETEMVLADGIPMRRYVRVVALDVNGKHLSTSRPVDLTNTIEIWGDNAANIERPEIHGPLSTEDDADYMEADHDFDVPSPSSEDDYDPDYAAKETGDEPEDDDSAGVPVPADEYEEEGLDTDETVEETDGYDQDSAADEPGEAEVPEINNQHQEPYDPSLGRPDLPEENEKPTITPQKPPPVTTSPTSNPSSGQSGGLPLTDDGSYSDKVTNDQLLLVLGLVFGVAAALLIRLTCYRRGASTHGGYRSNHLWYRVRQQLPGSKKSYAYGEIPTSVRESQ